MPEEKSLCPHCKGKRFIRTGYTEKIVNGRRSLYPYALPCYCDLNISIAKKFGMLSAISEATPEDSQLVYKKYSTAGKNKGNFIFYGDESSFLYTVKCQLLMGFTHHSYELLEGKTIVEKYNMPDPNGTGRLSIDVLDNFDLVAILFTSQSEPPTLKACIVDVIKSRLRLVKPTWIFSRVKELNTTKEYSQSLDPFIDSFVFTECNSSIGFKSFSKGVSDRVKIQKSRDIQDALGVA
jgi:hypothetical protein